VTEDPASALTFSELSDLNQRKLAIKREHNEYIDGHPEIKGILNDFMSAVLLEKPDNVFEFANEHFAELAPEHAQGVSAAGFQPMVVCGPSGVGKGESLTAVMLVVPI
jgi:guanylate kinase